jgi:hypothetical protein
MKCAQPLGHGILPLRKRDEVDVVGTQAEAEDPYPHPAKLFGEQLQVPVFGREENVPLLTPR